MDANTEGLTIREVAARTQLSPHTLRYYERIGLIPTTNRTPSGHRAYNEADLGWVTLLQRLRTTGMPIREMQRFAELVQQGDATVGERRALLEAHRQTLRKRLGEIKLTIGLLDHKIETYRALETAEVKEETR